MGQSNAFECVDRHNDLTVFGYPLYFFSIFNCELVLINAYSFKRPAVDHTLAKSTSKCFTRKSQSWVLCQLTDELLIP